MNESVIQRGLASGGTKPGGGRSAVSERVLIIGLDGATLDVLNPLMAEGRMPRLQAAVAAGACGPLLSTIPPITPAAWTTFLTGKQPGHHRILDFEGYDVNTGRIRLHSTFSTAHVRNIWQILSDHGLKVGSVNVPMTYPPIPVNGFMVTGFDTPGPECDFSYPADLKAPILQRWPDPTGRKNWRAGIGKRLFNENLDYLSRSFHQGAEMTTWLGDRFGWDVLMVVFKFVDNLQHKTWKYLDPRWSGRNPYRRDRVKDCFAELDKAVGQLLDYATAHRATVLMVSDHGHGSLEGKVHPNRLLEQWEYLKLRGPVERLAARCRLLMDRWRGRPTGEGSAQDIERYVPVDLSQSKACVMHAGNAGFLYVNLKGRQPGGIVDPADYERLRDELKKRFLSPECRVRDPWGQEIPLFPGVYKPEELYRCSRADEPWLPDLLLMQYDTLSVVRRLRGRCIVQWLPYSRLEGTHRMEGIFIATGPGVCHRKDVSARLLDCAPTILAMLGLRIPNDMSGRVLTEIFERPPTIEQEAALPKAAVAVAEEVYSERELQLVTERLSNLGYLE